MGSNKILINVIDTTWRSELAYVIGLIASDGYLAKTVKEIGITSKEIEMVNLFQKALSIKNKIGRSARGGETEKKYYYARFKSKQFYSFLNSIGITTRKSKTIQSVEVPDNFFSDFLRGLFDGDGTFWTFWDTRWPNAFGYHICFYSASKSFMKWLQIRLHNLYSVNGHIKRGDGVFEIRYAKRDSKKLFEVMYHKSNILFLERKYRKIKDALDFDLQIKQNAHTPR
jgi:hypothetical protein